MTSFTKISALSAVFVFSVSVSAVWANDIPGPPCLPGETRSGWVFERSQVPNTNFVVHLTDSAGGPVGPAAGIPLAGTNVPGDGSQAALPGNRRPAPQR